MTEMENDEKKTTTMRVAWANRFRLSRVMGQLQMERPKTNVTADSALSALLDKWEAQHDKAHK